MKSVSVILLCFLSFFVGCLFSACFISIDSSVNKVHDLTRNSKVMKVYSAVKNPVKNSPTGSDLIVLVISAPSNVERRQLIRETWAKDLKDHKFSYLFSIGMSGLSEELSNSLRKEQFSHSDIVFLPHVKDQYNLLSIKVLHTMVWLNSNSNHRLILKCDDDSFINVKELVKSPVFKVRDSLIYWGYFTGRAPVHQRGKWKESEWNICDHYVPYARGGGYILSQQVIQYLAANAQMLSTYQSEDVSVGLWLAPLNVTRHHDINFDTEYKSRGCKNSYIVTHPHSIASMRNMHKALLDNQQLCIKEEVASQAYIYNWNVLPTQCCQKIIQA